MTWQSWVGWVSELGYICSHTRMYNSWVLLHQSELFIFSLWRAFPYKNAFKAQFHQKKRFWTSLFVNLPGPYAVCHYCVLFTVQKAQLLTCVVYKTSSLILLNRHFWSGFQFNSAQKSSLRLIFSLILPTRYLWDWSSSLAFLGITLTGAQFNLLCRNIYLVWAALHRLLTLEITKNPVQEFFNHHCLTFLKE